MTCFYMKHRNGLKRLICKTFQVKNENGKLDESKKDIEWFKFRLGIFFHGMC